MPKRTRGKATVAARTFEQIFRHWVAVRDLRDGSSRELPLRELTWIHLPTRRHREAKPNRQVLQLEDGADILRADSLDDLATQLRQKYPDEIYERTLHRERDHEAERRREKALDDLGNLFVERALDQLLRGSSGKKEGIT